MSILLKGEEALILAECCKYSKEQKEAEKKLKKAKAKLELLAKGEYINGAGDTLVISEAKKKSDIDPKELFFKLRRKGVVKKFFDCVKVNVTDLKKILALSEIEKMQEDLDPIKRYSFK